MKRAIAVIAYSALVVAGIVLGIFKVLKWWVALSPIWFPVAVGVSLFFMMFIAMYIGDRIKAKYEEEFVPNCANCLFNHTKEITHSEQCLGEKMKAEINADGICSFYERKN